LAEGARAAGLIILRRILSYARKRLDWESPLDAVCDTRPSPQIPTATVIRSVAVMFLARLGSLNALEQSSCNSFWRKWLGAELPSADTVGRVCAEVQLDGVRQIARQVYTRLKRGKALCPPAHGLMAAVLDGHESHATYRCCCRGCLQRTIETRHGPKVQYYHRHVTLQLVGLDLTLLLDAEPIRPGEGEIAVAIRLLERVLEHYPRAFDVIMGDGLYANSTFFNYVLSRGKHALAVLKDETRDLWADSQSLFAGEAPVGIQRGRWQADCWDLEGFTSWPQVDQPVRVVQSLERTSVRRQLDGREELVESRWAWVTTLAGAQASTRAVLELGHRRWAIENEGFNELSTRQHSDHVYRHDAQAMLVFLLLGMICCNVLLAFYQRDLKPALRDSVSMLHVSRLIAGELYHLRAGLPRAPM